MMRILFLVTTLIASTPAWVKADILNSSAQVPFTILDQTLASTLEEFGSNAGVPMTIDRRVTGRVTNFNDQLSARGFLDQLAADHGFVWYFDGTSIHVTPASENRSVIIDFSQVSAARLNDALAEMGVSDQRFVMRQADGSGMGVVTGPPRYVDIVESAFLMLAKVTTSPKRPRVATKQITVIRGEQVEIWAGAARISTTATAPVSSEASKSAESGDASDKTLGAQPVETPTGG